TEWSSIALAMGSVSDHGLQNGVHTHEAMVAGTSPRLVEGIDSVLDVRGAIEAELRHRYLDLE
ncbi:hypothetical protein, partial [Citrobacter youngae]|uniref:hypothetical protein n=1 Tax=Citrobacter youngae TaxID=133448 RepID=UPI001954D2C0